MQNSLSVFMKTNPEGTLEKFAADYNTNLLEVIKLVPNSVIISGQHFDHVWNEAATWDGITFLVHTADVIIEYSGILPSGFHKQGYFNLKHTNGFSGHIKAENCTHIAFVTRQFMGKDTASILFLNSNGDAMFKIFVGRDENRQLKQHQLSSFFALSQKLQKQ